MEPATHNAVFTIRHNTEDDPNVYGEAPDIVSACMLMGALYARTGQDLCVADGAGATAAWVGRETD